MYICKLEWFEHGIGLERLFCLRRGNRVTKEEGFSVTLCRIEQQQQKQMQGHVVSLKRDFRSSDAETDRGRTRLPCNDPTTFE